MRPINVLPPDIVSKIAAGEVIERPASVIKELLENSLDAGAQKIDIYIKQAGQTLIRIKDDGHGIAKDDIEKVFQRHATSKINTADDLYSIASLGFRGEALYSVAAVADIILRSKIDGQETGWELHIRGGAHISLKPVAMQRGTEIEVNELFYNTPARRKFLKTKTTEYNQILSIIIPYILIHNVIDISFTTDYKSYERTVFHHLPDEEVARRIARVLNIDNKHILESEHAIADRRVSFKAFLGDSNIRRTSKDMQYIFINGRPVMHRLLNYQLNDMFRLIFPSDIYPFFVLFLTVPAEDVDVNIHPTKREVKIVHEYDLCKRIRSLCEETLLSWSKAKQVVGSPFTMPAVSSATEQQPGAVIERDSSDYIKVATQNLLETFTESVIAENHDTLKVKLRQAHFVGAFYKKYLLFEAASSLLIIDQHAAAERINYELLKRQVEQGNIEVQQLLTPLPIKVTHQEFTLWEEVGQKLEDVGFFTTQWDNETIAIHAYPQLIKDPEMAFRNLLSGTDVARCDKETLARRACRSSVMAGDTVEREGAESLRTQLIDCNDPFVCPHGRPTVIEIQEPFLSKQFLRT
ncbi:MAG: DNA mismatch repair endonuclease MutL [Candidatus Omnitrophica bacterium]|nr:DNA mismatch repair endonuclease MutL [Candidatus Omnitrophota bacterium]